MFTVWFSEGGQRLAEREWPVVPRVGETVNLHDCPGRFEVIRVHWEEHAEATDGLAAHISVRTAGT